MQFIDPKTDFALKRIFGSEDSKTILMNFINSLLELEGEREAVSVEIQNPYQAHPLPDGQKDSPVHVAYTDGTKTKYLVEIHLERIKGFPNRMIYNLSKCYSGQSLKRGRRYIHDVAIISIMDFSFPDRSDSYHSIFAMHEDTTGHMLNQLRLCCLELANFNKREDELSGMIDKWAYFLKTTGRLKERPEALKDQVFDEAFEKVRLANLSKEEQNLYNASIQEAGK